ncbi:MAG TPA: hypothetical protein VEI28_06580 [Thermodesulfovibrionales bacterium]|nr:hypothetical protein [Thermodesulfovibrionales bacterium]
MANRFIKQPDEKGGSLFLDEEELDAIRSLLIYILMKNTHLEREEIYTYIFGEGKRIVWH